MGNKSYEGGFCTDIEKDTEDNKDYRKVLYTGPNAQLVLMSLKPKEDIGKEKHKGKDQFIRVEEGSGEAVIGNKKYSLKTGDAVVIPAGTEHNINASENGLKIYTIYTSQNHPDGTVEKTKEDAEKEEGKENKYDVSKSIKTKTIAIDFDGVINSYTSGWKGVKQTDRPVKGAADAIKELYEQGNKIIIFSTRANNAVGRSIIRKYISNMGLPDTVKITAIKPPADVYIDDRALNFNGNWKETVIEAENFKPYMQKSLTWSGHKLQGRTNFQGLDISIENKKGSVRRGVDKDGHKWATKMHYDYGYARKTEGKDGDFLDIYLGPDKDSKKVYIVHQNDPVTGKYDEDKCMLGFDSAEEAKQAYMKQYDRPGFFGSMEEIDIDTFRRKAMEDKNKGKKLSIEKAMELIKDILHKALPPKPENIEDSNAHKTPPEGYPEQKKEYGSPNEYKYPLDTEEHVRAALAYFSKPKNYGMYSNEERKAIWARIVKAAKRLNIVVDMEHKFSDKKETEKSIRLVVPAMKKAITGYSQNKYMMGLEDGNVLEANVLVTQERI
jgi:mannose-6-phosphate isomerase-like protein (cupin superfamily)